ncbi:hypothetical protein NKG05_18565 [Oerskovia sp. M15]
MAPDWAAALTPVEPQLRSVGDFLRAETAAGRPYQPAPSDILRAFQRPLADVRVLIVGQDPTPRPGTPWVCPSPSSRTCDPSPVAAEHLRGDGDRPRRPDPAHGDLSSWSDQGSCCSTGC